MSSVENGLKGIGWREQPKPARAAWQDWLPKMSVSKVQVGQVWKKAGSDESFLVTRLYSEALTTFAVLRPAGKETAAVVKVKVIRKGTSQALPGFSMAQDSDEF
jgi:hypothetical protein